MNKMILVKAFAIIIFVSTLKVDALEPCNTTILVDDITRSASRFLGSNEAEKCDTTIHGWVRLKINKTDADMPTSCIDVFRCGSSMPIWLNGTLPEIENDVVSLDVCYRGFMDCCEKRTQIQLKNCGTYNVYLLKPVDTCNARYCVAERIRCPLGESSRTGYEPNCQPINITFKGIARVQPIEPNHDVYSNDEHMLKFRCNVNIPVENKGHVFDLKWDLNGKTILANDTNTTNIKEEDFIQQAVLTADDLKRENQTTMGFKLKCSVRARLFPNSVPTVFQESEEFFAGIMVDTSTLIVNAGETAVVQIRSTVPITCSIYHGIKIDCHIRFQMLEYKAGHGQICKTNEPPTLCSVYFDAWKWNTFQKLTIPTKSEQRIINEYPAIVKLKSGKIRSDDLWNDYLLPDIAIRIRGKTFIPASCRSVSDPHVFTFDGRYFTTFETGEYVLYKHLQKPIAVHVIHKSLGSYPRWNCAVAVQAGADTFIVYGCDRRWRHRRAFCDKEHGSYLDVYERNQGKNFEVHLPTGARVSIQVQGTSNYRFLNIQVYAATSDVNLTGGLCGKFNRNSNDDFTDPRGQISEEIPFKTSWHVNPVNSLFIAKARKEVLERSQYGCSCNKTPIINGDLYTKAYCDCDESTPVCTTPTYSEQQCQYKHKRETRDDDEIDAPLDYRKTWLNGWNEAKARDHCNSVLHHSRMYTKCKEIVHFKDSQSIQMCMEDIKFLGTSELSHQVDKPLTEACKNIVRLNSTLWSDDHSKSSSGIPTTSYTSSIIEKNCLNDCSVGGEIRGACENGQCSCFQHYTSEDCSVDTQKAPVLEASDDDSVCDTAISGCSYLNVYGDNFFNTGSHFKCRLEEQKITNETNDNTRKHYLTEAELVSFGEVRCQLPRRTNRRRRAISMTQPASFLVSITTNGNLFSNKVPVVIYDSSCTDCVLVNGNFSCTQKNNICIVKGKCVDLINNLCGSKSKVKRDESKHLVAIGVGLGVVASIFILALVVAKIRLKFRKKKGAAYDCTPDQSPSCVPNKT